MRFYSQKERRWAVNLGHGRREAAEQGKEGGCARVTRAGIPHGLDGSVAQTGARARERCWCWGK